MNSIDICDLNLIYNADFNYSLPRSELEKYFSGKAFDHAQDYTPDEQKCLQTDINDLFQKILSSYPAKEKIAVITAGAPGAGKTVKLRQDLEGKNYAYVCPDDVCLKQQTNTYLADIESLDAKSAYNKWRPGSNAAAHVILANLIRENYAFYFGSTSSGAFTWKSFEFLKNQGYRIRLIHVTAPDDVRWNSIKERDKVFIQTTEDDVREKGKLLPQRISDTFLKYADEIDFYYRNGVHEDAVLAANWLKSGSLKIIDKEAYYKIKRIHNEAAKSLSRPDLAWESTIENL